MAGEEQDPVAAYKEGIARRAALQRQKRKETHGMPDLTKADAMYDPKHGTSTLSGIAGHQQRIDKDMKESSGAGLNEGTVAGLRAIKEAVEKKVAAAPPVQEQAPEPSTDEAPAESDKTRQALLHLDDLELEQLSNRIQYDVINNKKEREAVEKRIKDEDLELNIESGILNGVYSQVVPITDNLRVEFRTISPEENKQLRVLLWKWLDEDPSLEPAQGDIYGMMLIVAGVVQIGTRRLPDHLVGADMFSAKFDAEVFTKKYQQMSRYPAPLVHALGVHNNWFDTRVRRLFTTAALQDF